VAEIFAAIAQEQLSLFEQLNDRADLRADAADSARPESFGLSGLVQLITVLDRPFSPAMKQALLQLMLTFLAPAPAEQMLGQVHENAQVAQRRLEQLWLYAQQLERRCEEQKNRLEVAREQMAEQHARSEAQSHQLRRQERELSDQTARIESLAAELDRVYESRTWKVIRAYSNVKERLQRKVS
jgi:hypothetical protein